jgi:hypothetical protein
MKLHGKANSRRTASIHAPSVQFTAKPIHDAQHQFTRHRRNSWQSQFMMHSINSRAIGAIHGEANS